MTGPANGTGPRALEVTEITKRYGPVVALRGVSLALDYGEVLGLVGDNGAGKSTLISIISGVAGPTRARSGWTGGRGPRPVPAPPVRPGSRRCSRTWPWSPR